MIEHNVTKDKIDKKFSVTAISELDVVLMSNSEITVVNTNPLNISKQNDKGTEIIDSKVRKGRSWILRFQEEIFGHVRGSTRDNALQTSSSATTLRWLNKILWNFYTLFPSKKIFELKSFNSVVGVFLPFPETAHDAHTYARA